MNPSASGWLNKLLTLLPQSAYVGQEDVLFYKYIKQTGFIYGSNVSLLPKEIKQEDFNEEELCKVNLISAFYYIYKTQNSSEDFTTSIVEFYKSIEEHKRSFLSDLFGEPSSDKLVERIIQKRIHIDDNILTKNFNYFLINVFLFVDVLGYRHFLKNESQTKAYINNLESAIESIVFDVLDSKSNKTEYDQNIIKLFESSIRQKTQQSFNDSDLKHIVTQPLEKQYIIDIVCMACWSDVYIDKNELEFLIDLKTKLEISNLQLLDSIDDINNFYSIHKDHIAFLKSKNLAKSFYENSSNIVKRLIKRNSKRLIKELSQSKEAIELLAKSTHSDLTDEEQKKIQNQLLDIFKSIPSLAIFILPGGMILLPLFIKFIPKLLPSAFDENRIENE